MSSVVMRVAADRVVHEHDTGGVYRLEHRPSGHVYIGSSSKIDDRHATRMQSLRRFYSRPDYYSRQPEPWRMLGWSQRFYNAVRLLSADGWHHVWLQEFLPGTPLLDIDAAELAEIQRCHEAAPSLLLNVLINGGVPSYLHEGRVRAETVYREPAAGGTGSFKDRAAKPKPDLPFLQDRLWSSDVRSLSCRVDPDPRSEGCCKERFAVAERRLWLCPKRVALFRSAPDGTSLSGVRCDAPSLL